MGYGEIYNTTWWGVALDTARTAGTEPDFFGSQMKLLTSNQPELVTNGDFISNVNNWGTDSGATITWQSDQTALVASTADNTFAIVQGNVLTVNRKYKVSLKFKPNNTGTFRVRLGGSSVTFSTSVFNVNEWNNIEFIGIADNTTLEIGSSGGSITNFYIDNISVKVARLELDQIEAKKCLADWIHTTALQDLNN